MAEFKSACEKNKTSREFLEAEQKFDDKTSTSILTKDASLESRPEARKVTVTQESGKSGTNETLEGLNKTKDKEPSEETSTEGETLIRVKWVQGMKCPVENCLTGNTNFFTLTSFHHHWEIRHYPCVREFKCPRCGFQNLQRDRVGKHIKMLHGMVLHIQSVSVKNVNYIDPGQYYCPPLELFKAEAGPKEMEEMKQFRADMTTTSPLEKKENDSRPVDQLHQEFTSACEKNKTSREFLEAEEKFVDKTSTSILTKDASLEGRPEARKVTVTQQSGKSGTNETLEGLNKTKDKEPSEETNTEGETLIRVKWVQGMKCPVENCLTGNTYYFTLTSFHHHWEIRHYPCVREFKCPRCGFQNLQRDRVGKHIKMLHGMVLHIQIVSVKNVNYIDPGQYYCPPLELFKAEAGPKDALELSIKLVDGIMSLDEGTFYPKRDASGGLQKKATQPAEKKLSYPNKLTFVPGMPCPVENCSTLHFASLPAFEHHWNEQHAQMLKTFACVVCNFKSIQKSSVFMHVRNEHGIPTCVARGRITTVMVSNSQYLDAEELYSPELLREESKSFVMVKPDDLEMDHATDQKGEIEKHRKITWMAGMSCPVSTCGSEIYLNLDSFYSHWKNRHHMEFQMLQCSQCTFKASQKSEIENHLKSHHWILAEKDIKAALTKVKAVKVFNPSFKDSEGYHFELRKTEEEGENMPFKSENKPLQQVSNEEKRTIPVIYVAGMSCPVVNCGVYIFASFTSFKYHWRNIHHPFIIKLQCPYCTTICVNKSELQKHLQSVHGVRDRDLDQSIGKAQLQEAPNKQYKDSGKFYFKDTELENLQRLQQSQAENTSCEEEDTKDEGQTGKDTIKVEIKFSGESKYKLSPKKEKVVWFFGMSCPVTNCGARNFVSLRAFHNHWENVHYPFIKKFECPVCQYNNTQREMIVNHLKLLHNTIKTNDVRDLSQIKLVDVSNPMYKDPGRFYFGNVPSMPSKNPDVETMASTSPEQGKEMKIEKNDRDNPNASKAEICAKTEASKNKIQDMDRQEDIVLGEKEQGHLGMRIEKTSNQGVRKDKTLKLIPQQSQAKCKEDMEKSDYEEKGMSLDGNKESIYKTKDKSLGENQARVSENVDNTCDTNGGMIKEAIKMVEELKKSDENIGKIDEQKELISTLHATEKQRKIDTIGKRKVNQSAENSKNNQQKVEEHVKQKEANGKNVDPTVQERKDMKLEKSEKDESEAQKHQGAYSGLKEQKKLFESTQEADVNRENILTKDTTQRVDNISDKDEKSRMPAPKNQEKQVTTSDTSEASVESTKKSSSENVDLRLKSLSSESAAAKKEPIKVVFVSNMSCPVDKCGTLHFTSLSAFEDHWMKRHLPVREHFKCRICNFRNIVRKTTYRHVNKVHGIMYPMLHQNIYIVTDTNSQFLDPGPLQFEKCLSQLAEVAKNTNGTKSASAMQKKEEKVTTSDTSKASVESTKKSSSENVDLRLKSLSSESAAGKKKPIKVVFVSNMLCPVDKCGTLHFTSLSAFEDHWMKRHLPVQEHFKCRICNFRNIVRKTTYRHVNKVHGIMYPMLHQNIYIVTDTNSQFLDPGPLQFEKCLSQLAEVAKSTSGTKSASAMQKKEEKGSKKGGVREKLKPTNLDEPRRVIWILGMDCPVDICNIKRFSSWQFFCNHWEKVHQPYIEKLECPLCTYKHIQRSIILQHIQFIHQRMDVKLERMENPEYIDPGGLYCAELGETRKKTPQSLQEKQYVKNESKNTLQKERGKIVVEWKYNMTCPVYKCDSKIYTSWTTYCQHWKIVHEQQFLKAHACPKCSYQSRQRSYLISHMKHCHKLVGMELERAEEEIKFVDVENPSFIDPGNHTCNWFGKISKSEKSYAGASSENGKTDVRKDSQAGGDTEMIDVLPSDEEGVVYWKENGMVCPVPKCSRDVFLRLDLMQYHWKEKHTLFLEFFHCQLCGKRSLERKQLIKHLFLDHFFPYRKAKEISRMARLQKAKNPKYMDPGRLVCPQFRLQDSQQGKSISNKSSTDKIRVEKEAKRSDDAKEMISVSQAATETREP